MKLGKPVKLFFLWALVMIGMIWATMPAERPDKLAVPDFGTRSADELYFRNVRMFYYNTSEEAGGILEVYRFAPLFEDTGRTSLPFALYHNWRSHECFIRLDTNRLDIQAYTLITETESSRDTLAWPTPNNDDQYRFAYSVYKALNSDSKISFQSRRTNERIPLRDGDLKSIRMTLRDYYKLIGKL